MGTFSDEMLDLAAELLDPEEFGKELATFTRDTGTGQDPTTLIVTESATSYTALVAPMDFTTYELNTLQTVTSGNKKLYVQAAGTVPKIGDKVTLGGVVYRLIKQLNLYETQNVDCLYIFEIGK